MLSGQEMMNSPLIQRSTVTGLKCQRTTGVSIENLVNDVLCGILGFLVDVDKKIFDGEECDIYDLSSTYRALQLSSVCRTFRSALFSMHGAWVVVSSRHPGMSFLKLCLERSSIRGLRLYHSSFYNYDLAVKLLGNLVTLQNDGQVRIDLVSVKLKDVPEELQSRDRSPEDEVVHLLGKLDNRFLSNLSVAYFNPFREATSDAEDEGEEEEEGGEADGEDDGDGEVGVEANNDPTNSSGQASYELLPLLQSPRVVSAHFENTIPRPGAMLFLRKLSLTLQANYENTKWHGKLLLDLLRQLPTLEDFALEFSENGTFVLDDAFTACERVNLPLVRSVSLSWHASTRYGGNHLNSNVPTLFEHLELDNVKTFRLVVHRKEEYDEYEGNGEELPLFLEKHFEFFLGENGRFAHLESFHLKFFSTGMYFFRLPASLLHNIKHLSLNFNVSVNFAERPRLIKYENNTASLPLPHLQTLTLVNCDGIGVDAVIPIVNAIRAGGNWENFQRLVVDDCRYLSQSWITPQLEKLVGSEKLTVYPLTRIFLHT